MRITLAAIADWAATTDKGKLVIGGVFDTVRVSELPARHPMMVLALRMTAQPGEAPVHQVSVRMVDPDGENVVPEITGRVQLGQLAHEEGAGMQFVLHMPNVPLSMEGPHAVDIFVDGMHLQSLPLYVRLTNEADPAVE